MVGSQSFSYSKALFISESNCKCGGRDTPAEGAALPKGDSDTTDTATGTIQLHRHRVCYFQAGTVQKVTSHHHTPQCPKVTTTPQAQLGASFPRSSPLRLTWSSKPFSPGCSERFCKQKNNIINETCGNPKAGHTYLKKNLFKPMVALFPARHQSCAITWLSGIRETAAERLS